MRVIGALVTAIIAAVVAMFAGLALIVSMDFLARALGWAGVSSPSTGWLVVGAIAGGVIGLVEGLRRAGRPVARKHVAMGAAAAIALLIAASAAWQRTGAASGPTVSVIAEGLNVRAEPDNTSRVIGSVARGTTLRVLNVSTNGDWYRVETTGAPRMTGWVGARFVSGR